MTAAVIRMSNVNPIDYGVGIAAACLVAGLVGFGMARLGDEPVHVQVFGELSYADPIRIADVVSQASSEGFFSSRGNQVEAAIEALPWVEWAEVERLWPDRIAVHIGEHRPLAVWGDDQVLVAGGELIRPHDLPALELRVQAPDARADEVARELGALLREPHAQLRVLAWSVSESGDRRAQLSLDGQPVTVELGRLNVAQAIDQLFALVLPAIADRLNDVDTIDMRYRNGFAVRWRDSEEDGQ